MKTSGSILLAMLFGGVGFAAGYFVARKKFYNLADKEVQSFKDMIPEHDRKLLIAAGLDPDKVELNYRKNDKSTVKSSATITPDYINRENKDRLEEEIKSKPLNEKFNYANICKTYKTPEPAPTSKLPTETDTIADVEIISEDRANLESDEYPTQLIYYKDGVIADIDDNPISNYQRLIGEIGPILEEIRTSSVAYVLNKKTREVYMVEHSENKWSDIATTIQKDAFLNLNKTEDDK